MRNIFRKLKQDGQNILSAEQNLVNSDPEVQAAIKRRNTLMQGNGVGDVEEIGEFGLGIAPNDSRPVNKIELSKAKEEEIALMQAYEEDMVTENDQGDQDMDEANIELYRLKNKQQKKRKKVDRQTAFLEFKQTEEGVKMEQDIKDNKAQMKGIKKLLIGLTQKCNAAKGQIDTLKGQLEAKQ
jgi:hypothetical protein